MKATTNPKLPTELEEALNKDAVARKAFEGMPASHRGEYGRYVGEAKKAETRVRRAEKAVGMMREWARKRSAER